MRHRKGFNHLGRTSAHRKAMLSNMASSLILHKRITTTTAKAKALRTYIEPLITRSKDDTTHSRRVVFSYLKNKYAVSELFREVSPKIVDRPGGYTRILKTGNRLGDNAEMCIIELVDYNENMLEDAAKKTRSARRRRGSGKAKASVAAPEAAIAGDVETTTDVEEIAPDAEEAATDAEDLQSEATEEVKAETSTSVSGEDRVDKDSKVKGEVKEEEKAEAVEEEKQEVEKELEAKAESKDVSKDKETEEGKSETTDNEEDKKE